MWIKSITLTTLCGLLLLLTTGCQDLVVKTVIHRNGACQRTLIVEADSSGIEPYAYPLPLPLDSSWSTMKNDENESGLILRKAFRKVRELNAELALAPDSTIKIEVSLKKKFRWFYTFLTYKETYKPYAPYSYIPLTEHLSEEEIVLFHAGAEDSDLEDRVEEWLQDNIIEHLFLSVVESAKELAHPGLPAEAA